MKNISTLYIMKRLLVSIAIVFISILTVAGQNHSFSLSGKWNFQIDREDTGVKEQWFKKIPRRFYQPTRLHARKIETEMK